LAHERLLLGAHLPITGGLHKALERAAEINCASVQLFTRNPRGWRAPPLDISQVELFRSTANKLGLTLVAHASYLPNLASPNDKIYQLSLQTIQDELNRCDTLGIPYLVLHIGSHLGAGFETGFKRLVSGCRTILDKFQGKTMLLLENMSGQANSMGSKLEDIARILEALDNENQIGVCLDTCHLFQAGYELRSEKALEMLLGEIEEFFGVDRVKVIHLNDSKAAIGSGLDRHERIGKGYIGPRGFSNILKHKALRRMPMILETPVNEWKEYEEDLQTLRSLI